MDSNGLYVPQSKGTSIMDILNGHTNNGNPNSGNHNGNMNPNMNHNNPNMNPNMNPQMYNSGNYNNYNRNYNQYNVANQHNNQNNTNQYQNQTYQTGRSFSEKYNSINSHDMDDDSSYISNEKKLEDVADNVNKNLDKRRRRKKRKTKNNNENKDYTDDDTEDNENEDNENGDNDTKDIKSNDTSSKIFFDISLSTILEPILLLTLFVIMSQPFVIEKSSEYIKFLNPDENNTIPLIGIVIYGSLLVFMFMILRFLLV